jgi:hypothetical protein
MIKTHNIIYILFLLVYGVDSVLTIVKRMKRKENIFEAHRSHLYQFLANENKMNPLLISVIYATLQLLFGVLVIGVTGFSTEIQLYFSIGIILSVGFSYIFIKNSIIKKYNIQQIETSQK